MTNFEIIKQLCDKEGIAVATLEKEMNYGNGSLSKAKRLPAERIMELSKRFDVSMEFLMTGKDNADSSQYSDLADIYLSYAKEAQDNGIDPDDIKLALNTIRHLRREK